MCPKLRVKDTTAGTIKKSSEWFFGGSFLLIMGCAAAAAKSLQSCLTLCNPTDGSPPGFFKQEHWSGLPFPSPMHESEKWKWNHSVSHIQLFTTPWTAAHQAPPSIGVSRQEYWSGVPHTVPQIHSPAFWSWMRIQVPACAVLRAYPRPWLSVWWRDMAQQSAGPLSLSDTLSLSTATKPDQESLQKGY